jgi:arylsulfatase A-like enzyme
MALGLGACRPTETSILQRNVLVISIDTLRADHLGIYGYERSSTPKIDDLAKTGTWFRNAYAPSPWTKPSHASLFTGLYPRHHGAASFELGIADDVGHIAETLSGQGFETVAFVSNPALTTHGLERGFQTLEYIERQGRAPTRITPRAVDWLRTRKKERPFFALLHYNDPHADYCARTKFEKRFERDYEGPVTGKIIQLFAHTLGAIELDQADAEHLIDLYDAAIYQLDGQIGALLRAVESEGLLENTLIVLTSDHGEEFLDHGDLQHGLHQFQESVRVPLIFAGPGVSSGGVAQVAVSLIDIAPTIFEHLGIPTASSMDGVSLVPLLVEADSPEAVFDFSRWLFFEANCARPTPQTTLLQPGSERAIQRGAFKLHYDEADESMSLYDLSTDPGETRDVQSEHLELVAEMLVALKTFLAGERPGKPEQISDELLERFRDLGYAGN